MIEFLTVGPNLAFTAALAAMLSLGALELLGLLFGASLSQLLDDVLPGGGGAGGGGLDVDAAPGGGPLAWLGVGAVPAYVLGILLLAGFGLCGLTVQFAMVTAAGRLLPAAVSWLPALAGGLVFARVAGRLLARSGVFNNETTAVSPESFLGWPAVVTLGAAKAGAPAEAKTRDPHGQTHYLLVEPVDPADVFPAGTAVVLVKRAGAVFGAVRDLGDGRADAAALRPTVTAP